MVTVVVPVVQIVGGGGGGVVYHKAAGLIGGESSGLLGAQASLGMQRVRGSFGQRLYEIFTVVLATSRIAPKWWPLGDSMTSSGSENLITCQTVRVPEVGCAYAQARVFFMYLRWIF